MSSSSNTARIRQPSATHPPKQVGPKAAILKPHVVRPGGVNVSGSAKVPAPTPNTRGIAGVPPPGMTLERDGSDRQLRKGDSGERMGAGEARDVKRHASSGHRRERSSKKYERTPSAPRVESPRDNRKRVSHRDGHRHTSRSRRSASRSRINRDPSNGHRKARRRNSSESSTEHPVGPYIRRPPSCPDDLSCSLINHPDHQQAFSHTCRRANCDYIWMESHRLLFDHIDDIHRLLSTSELSTNPSGTANETDLSRQHSHLSSTPGRAHRQRLSPQPGEHPFQPTLSSLSLQQSDSELFVRRVTTSDFNAKDSEDPQKGRDGGSRRHKTLRRPQDGYSAKSSKPERVRSPSTTLRQIDSHLKERLDGFTLLKELENLGMEVRTLRHLNHYRKPLSEQHSESTLAFQIDHSARRVEACVRRVRKLQHLLEATDVLQTRADDEVFFAEELLDVVENGEPKRAALMYGRSHTSTSLKPAGSSQHLHKSPLPPPLEGEGGGYYDDLLSPRLVHTSVSAPHATSRHSAKR